MEKTVDGHPLIGDLGRTKGMGVPSPTPIVPRGSKTERMAVRSHLIEAGDGRTHRPGKIR